MPEKNEAPGTQRHHGNGWPVKIWVGTTDKPEHKQEDSNDNEGKPQ